MLLVCSVVNRSPSEANDFLFVSLTVVDNKDNYCH